MRFTLFIAALALAGCSSDPPASTTNTAASTRPATTPNPVIAQGAAMPNSSTATTLTNSTSSSTGAVTVPQVDLGSPLPKIEVNQLKFTDGSLLSTQQSLNGQVPNVNPSGLPNNAQAGPNGLPKPSPTPVMQLMPNAANNETQATTLPQLLGIGHGGSRVWALVNDNAHAILRVGDKILNTTVVRISDDGVKLADGRIMTVAWTGAGNTVGINGVPNIDVPNNTAPVTNPALLGQPNPPGQPTPLPAPIGPPQSPATAAPQGSANAPILPTTPVSSGATVNQTLPATTPLTQSTPSVPAVLH